MNTRSPPLLLAATMLAAQPAVAMTTEAEVEGLVVQLGAEEFAVREAAAEKLATLGAAAADSLMAAAETSPDLEVALRARWLAEAVPITMPHDAPEAAVELARFPDADAETRGRIMHRLLRLDHDAGIEPLARIVRLERSTRGSRSAAALLAREWRPGDPHWPALGRTILAGLGSGGRPAARFLRSFVTATLGGEPAGPALDDALAVLAVLEEGREPTVQEGSADPDDDRAPAAAVRIFRRCVIELSSTVGRRDDALAVAGRLLAACRTGANADERLAHELAWLADHGLPEAVDLVDDRLAEAAPLVIYAAATCRRARDARAADELAAVASKRLADPATDRSLRLQAAILLSHWGSADWALAEYQAAADDPATPPGDLPLAGILHAELLHDRERHAEAAAVLRRVLDGRDDDDRMGLRLQRDPRTIRSRMLYFAACAAAAAGDTAGQRRLLDEALQASAKDVDALIAAYRLDSGAAPAASRVDRALDALDADIRSAPDEPDGYNEYAWLVANTTGDFAKALRYARRALDAAADPDNASYLDTLAHCRAAVGDLAGAVRTQWLAHRREPHNRTIRRNLDRFRALQAAP